VGGRWGWDVWVGGGGGGGGGGWGGGERGGGGRDLFRKSKSTELFLKNEFHFNFIYKQDSNYNSIFSKSLRFGVRANEDQSAFRLFKDTIST